MSGLARFAGSLDKEHRLHAFGMQLRHSPYQGGFTWNQILGLAKSGRGEDLLGHRSEFLRLAELARDLQKTE